MNVGQAQIEYLDRSIAGDHEIGRLDVSVDQSTLVSVLQSKCRLADDLTDVGETYPLAARKDSSYVHPVEALHD